MSKFYEVNITIYRTYVVEVDDDEGVDEVKAKLAEDVMGGDFDIGDCTILETESEITNAEILAYATI